MKSFCVAAAVAALATSAVAIPTEYGAGYHAGDGANSATDQAGATDADILNYALTLEHLEATFYANGLKKYSQAAFAAQGFDATFYKNLKEVAADEMTHVSFLTSALTAAGAHPVAACDYSFPDTDPKSFITVASILEGVGVTAYLGAAADIVNKQYLTAAGSILTVESRHTAYLRAALGESPFAQPFDVPLDLDEVYSLASQFITKCPPGNGKLPVKAFPVLTLDASSPSPAAPNSTAVFDTKGYVIQAPPNVLYCAYITVTGPLFTPATLMAGGAHVSCEVPSGIAGQSYMVLNNGNHEVNDDSSVAGPAILEVGYAALT